MRGTDVFNSPKPRHPDLGSRADKATTHPHRPLPQADGGLLIDPEIALKARGMDLQVEFYYSSTSGTNRELGVGRSATFRAYVFGYDDGTGTSYYVVRGDLNAYLLSQTSTSGGTTNYAGASEFGLLTTLSYDGTTWREYFPEGSRVEYEQHAPAGPSGPKYEISRAVARTGAVCTYAYGSGIRAGLLESILVPDGRLLTFSYAPSTPTSLLSSIEDWGGRRWTLQYDAARNLTTLATPTGCETKYLYGGLDVDVQRGHAAGQGRPFRRPYDICSQWRDRQRHLD